MQKLFLTFIATSTLLGLLWFLITPIMAASTAHPIGRGVFAITMLNHFTTQPELREDLLQNPDVDGLVLIVLWNQIEVQNNKFSWSDLDAALDAIAKAGKKVNLHFRAGMFSPEWVYGAGDDNGCGLGDRGIGQRGAVKFTFHRVAENVQTINQDETAPVPWDKYYLTQWKEFVTRAGTRYNNHPEISYVIAAGPSLTHATANNINLQDNYINPSCGQQTDLERFLQAGYSEDKVTALWKEMIDHYAKAFPNHHVTFAPTDDIAVARSAGQAIEIIDYGLKKYDRRFNLAPQHLDGILLPDVIDKCFSHNDCSQLALVDKSVKTSADTTEVGWQMIDMLRDKPHEKKQSLGPAIDLATNRLSASWLEIFNQDVRDPQFKSLIHSAHVRLRPSSSSTIPGDFNNDGKVNATDYNIILANFEKPYTIFDYSLLVENFGK